jgi:hypothetical protein
MGHWGRPWASVSREEYHWCNLRRFGQIAFAAFNGAFTQSTSTVVSTRYLCPLRFQKEPHHTGHSGHCPIPTHPSVSSIYAEPVYDQHPRWPESSHLGRWCHLPWRQQHLQLQLGNPDPLPDPRAERHRPCRGHTLCRARHAAGSSFLPHDATCWIDPRTGCTTCHGFRCCSRNYELDRHAAIPLGPD